MYLYIIDLITYKKRIESLIADEQSSDGTDEDKEANILKAQKELKTIESIIPTNNTILSFISEDRKPNILEYVLVSLSPSKKSCLRTNNPKKAEVEESIENLLKTDNYVIRTYDYLFKISKRRN